jgi:SAM-dependent methyltransferase
MARDDPKRVARRGTFDRDAELYHRARPGYPEGLFATLGDLVDLAPGCRVLEIGCGTGQATVPLAELGCEIVAVELGAGMARVARRQLARFPAVQVVVAAFEEWPLPANRFDLVLAATSWHWLDPSVRVRKAADALRPAGALATISTHHVAGGTESFFIEAQDCYQRWDPETPPGGVGLPTSSMIEVSTPELDQSERFGPVAVRRWEWDRGYSTSGYLDVLRTYSGHLALDHDRREGLLGCIAELIDGRYGGQIAKRYLTELRVARRTT